MTSKDVVIIGAGIIGLSTAYAILETFPSSLADLSITIIAEHGPHDTDNEQLVKYSSYTSPWAGAHFRPFPSKSKEDFYESKLTRKTFEKFKQLSVSHPESSIRIVQGIEYFEDPEFLLKCIGRGYSEGMNDFEVIPTEKLPKRSSSSPIKIDFGTKYTTWIMNAPHYLKFLYNELLKSGKVRFVHKKLLSLKQVNEIVPNFPIIVNCSGRGLGYFGGYDDKVYSIRGQTLLIDPPTNCPYLDKTITHQSKDGKWTFVIPRPLNGGVILGGTKQIKDSTDKPKEEDTKQLINMGQELFPELMKVNEKTGEKYFDIKRINVGFRPARKGGFYNRIDLKNSNEGRNNHIINNYGAGGMGYELSYGAGLIAVNSLIKVLKFDENNKNRLIRGRRSHL
ncbi:d-amino acid oxidase [Scheffersomyces amazonensis]|uniref:d-amino acid oxidase n=1 Tax=Scheffersomyces amazonensis TaxID=1078765 RepID=UPI00315DF8FF